MRKAAVLQSPAYYSSGPCNSLRFLTQNYRKFCRIQNVPVYLQFHPRVRTVIPVRMIQFVRATALTMAFLSLHAPAAFADCAKDFYGEVFCGAGRCARDREGVVWCSRFYDGDAQSTREGTVHCGKGRCAATSSGDIFCSSEIGGTVLVDLKGRVRCQGRCEPASATNCVNSLADSAR